MPYFKLANAPLGVMAAALVSDLDAAATPFYAEAYTGSIPATPATAITSQVKLGTITGSADPSATNSAGLITFNPMVQDDAADASGTWTWIRLFKGDGTVWADLDVGDLASSATAKANTVTVVAGGPLRVNAFTIQIG